MAANQSGGTISKRCGSIVDQRLYARFAEMSDEDLHEVFVYKAMIDTAGGKAVILAAFPGN